MHFLGAFAVCPSNTKAKKATNNAAKLFSLNPPHYNRFVLLVCLFCLLVLRCY